MSDEKCDHGIPMEEECAKCYEEGQTKEDHDILSNPELCSPETVKVAEERQSKYACCPFCGSTSLGIGRGTEDREGFPTYVFCNDCGAQGPWAYVRDKAVFTCTHLACEVTGWNCRSKAEWENHGRA